MGGTRGLKTEVPADLINQTFIQFGVEPIVRMLTRRISDSAPILRRHLVREAVIPVSPDHWKQLSSQTVAVLEFNCRTQCSDADFVFDHEGWTNGNVHAVVRDIEDRQRALLHLADGNDIRAGVRELLERLHRVALRGTGGVYFVPQAVQDAERSLKGLRLYIKGLLPWKTGQLESVCEVTPQKPMRPACAGRPPAFPRKFPHVSV